PAACATRPQASRRRAVSRQAAGVPLRAVTEHPRSPVLSPRHLDRPRAHPAAPPRPAARTLPLGRLVGFLLALPLTLAALAFAARRKGAPIIDPNALLRDDTDLLRERQAAHWARVHDNRRRHPRAASSAARR